MFIPPSTYAWLLPVHVDLAIVDKLALEGSFPSIGGLWPAVVYAIIFGVIRLIFQTVLFEPLAVLCMKLKLVKQNKISEIDKLLKKNGKTKITNEQIRTLSTSCLLSEAEVNKYIWNTLRNNAARRKIVKFSEAAWRGIFYTGFCILGYYTLFVPETAAWVLDSKQHWENWPYHPMSQLLESYYMLELGCYFHQLMWTEVTRSDALEMILHHFITILLIVFSYLTNYTRIGASILLVHDCSDVFLEIGKLFNYMSKVPEYRWFAQRICDSFFAVFAISFFVSRLVLYPRYMVYSQVVESPAIFGGIWPGYWYFAVLLLSLQGLHVFWFYLIFKMIFRLLSTGIDKDVRSDDEDESLEQESKTD